MPDQLDNIVELAMGRAAARGAYCVEREDLTHVIVNCCVVADKHEAIAALLGIEALPDGPRSASRARAYLHHRRGSPALPLTGPAVALLKKLGANDLYRNLIFPGEEEAPPTAAARRETEAPKERPRRNPELPAFRRKAGRPTDSPRREPEAADEPPPAERRKPGISTVWARAERIRRTLAAYILGQDRALDAIHAHALSAASRRNGPAFFVFLGAPGTGKRYTAKTLAKAMGLEHLAINCAQIGTVIETKLFLGEQSTISGSGPGVLTAFVEENPASLVCLEHFDAMLRGATAFLDQILSEGALTDLFTGRRVDFSRCAIVLHLDGCAAELRNPRLIARLEEEGGAFQTRIAAVEALGAATHMVHHGEEPVFAPAILAAIRDRAAICLFLPPDWEALRAIALRGFSRAFADCADLLGAPQMEATPEALEAAAAFCILERGGEAGPSAVSPGVLADRLMAALGRAMREREEDAPPPELLELDVPEASLTALSEALKELGEEPVQALLRRFERLACPVEAEWRDGNVLALVFAGPVALVKKTNARDFGEGGLRIELPETRFADVVGHDPAKTLLKRDLDLLNRWRELRDKGHVPPSGMLLQGAPGNGKTLLARAAAGEAGLPFIVVAGQELLELSRQEEIFKTARRYAPSLVFIDEIDGIGRRERSAFDPAVTALLDNLNGFSAQDAETPPIYVLAATNHPKNVDPALRRPGRIERSVTLDAPPPHLFFRQELLGLEVDAMMALLRTSRGMNGAELQAVRRELALAERMDKETVLRIVFDARYGPAVPLAKRERRLVSLHEAGHAVCAAALGVKVRYAALVCRKDRLGEVGRECVLGQGPRRALQEIACSLAGSLAEQIQRCGPGAAIRPVNESAGAREDLAQANKAAETAVATLGYDGLRCDTEGRRPLMPATQIHERAQDWLDRATRLAVRTLRRNWPAVRAVSAALFERDFLDGKEVGVIIAEHAPAAPPKRRGWAGAKRRRAKGGRGPGKT